MNYGYNFLIYRYEKAYIIIGEFTESKGLIPTIRLKEIANVTFLVFLL